ncbi:MAG: hypothetical protein QM773_02900 [Hyphomonadaceae bacterium]
MAIEFYGATREAERTVNRLLSLPASGHEQDWEFELADPHRVQEMLDAMETDLSFDERCAVALLTIASIDEAVDAGNVDPGDVQRANSILMRYAQVREAMIFYWVGQKRASNLESIKKVLAL